MTTTVWSPWTLVLPLLPSTATALLQNEDARQRLRETLTRVSQMYSKLLLRWVVRAAQVGAGISLLFATASLIYALLYYLVIPSRFHDQDVFFNYGQRHRAITQPSDGYTVPSASLNLHDPVHQWQSMVETSETAVVLIPGVKYDVIVELTLPESRVNAEVGVFMVTTSLWDAKKERRLAKSARSLMVLDLPAPVRWLRLGWWLVPYALGVTEPVQTLRLTAINGYVENAEFPVTRVDIELNTPNVQVYRAKLTVIAQLTGVRYLMYHWAVPTAVLFILNIAFVETLLLVILYAVYVLPQLDEGGGATVLEAAAADTAVLEAAATDARDKAKKLFETRTAVDADMQTDPRVKGEVLIGEMPFMEESMQEAPADTAPGVKEEVMVVKKEQVDGSS
uniref:Seipin n=2 Tax=Hyaloperonospora arabidopsidis (strain Emoy2) TaxID=559515 RepID=M4C312_HYAAE